MKGDFNSERSCKHLQMNFPPFSRGAGPLNKAQDYQLSAQSNPIIQHLFVSDTQRNIRGTQEQVS